VEVIFARRTIPEVPASRTQAAESTDARQQLSRRFRRITQTHQTSFVAICFYSNEYSAMPGDMFATPDRINIRVTTDTEFSVTQLRDDCQYRPNGEINIEALLQ
jgi:hypothetical protein